jgi:hypothetical protein
MTVCTQENPPQDRNGKESYIVLKSLVPTPSAPVENFPEWKLAYNEA